MTMTEGNKYVLDYITANSYPAIDPRGATGSHVARRRRGELLRISGELTMHSPKRRTWIDTTGSAAPPPLARQCSALLAIAAGASIFAGAAARGEDATAPQSNVSIADTGL